MAWRIGIVGEVQSGGAGRAGRRDDPRRPRPRLVPVVTDDPATAEVGEELRRTVEVGHLDVRRADRVGHVRVAPATAQQAVLVGELGGAAVEAVERRLGVQHLDGVDESVVGETDERRLGEVAAHRVERVRHVHDAALVPDRPGAVVGRQTHRHPLGQEQPDQLAGRRSHLLADDDPAREAVGQLDRAGDRVVVGDAQHVDAALDHRPLELVGRRRAVAAPHRVAVQVDPDPSGREGFRQVGMSDRRHGHPTKVPPVASPTWRSDRSGDRRRAKILFVTGASGFLGRHLVNGPASADWEIVAPSSTSLDLRNRDAVLDMVRRLAADGDRPPRLPQGRPALDRRRQPARRRGRGGQQGAPRPHVVRRRVPRPADCRTSRPTSRSR